MQNDGIATYQRAVLRFPRNVPLSVRYAESLMRLDNPKRAHEVLLDLFNVVPPTPAQAKLIAQAARYRYLAAKARREASSVSGDPIAPRLIELAEKLEGDATHAEEEARNLLAEQGKATPLPQLDRNAGGQQP